MARREESVMIREESAMKGRKCGGKAVKYGGKGEKRDSKEGAFIRSQDLSINTNSYC